MQIDTYTGGLFDTNAFLFPTPEGGLALVDAPQGSAEWLRGRGVKLTSLLITHGHIDHVADAAQIQADHGCRVVYHRDNVPMLTEPGFFRRLGFGWDIEPVKADLLLEETASWRLEGLEFQVLLVPGHCPGSLCFLAKEARILFGGDVLFAGGVGRWDLPGGDRDLLLSGIATKLLPLGDDVKVLPGHGPATTIGRERVGNPYL
ncbi:MAG TPA: MBL fold metallo-hydrolase [Chthoniobacteraceae bacterium]|nr:MBL fold metallo-hydrolase [Chthoniobacteraceae bacterium]